MTNEYGKINIIRESDIIAARQLARQTASALGFKITDVTRIVTAVSELARNIIKYADSGAMHWKIVMNGSSKGIEFVFSDKGNGIPDIEKAMEVGFSTEKGLGMGLPGAKKLTDEMEIESETGKGTIVTIRKWLRGLK